MNRTKQIGATLRTYAGKVAAGTSLLAASAGSAMAAGTGGFDETSVTAAISSNQTKAIAIVGAFLVAVWVLKSMGLLKRG